MSRRLRDAVRGPQPGSPDERGMSLAELLVYCLLIGVVLTIVGGLIIQSLRVQRETTSLNDSNNAAQTVLSGIELGVRNAGVVRVQNVSGGDQLLIVKRRSTTGAGTDAVCQAWYFDVSANQLRAATDPASGSPRSAVAAGNPSTALAWPLVLDEVARVGSTPVFQWATGTPVTVTFEVESTGNRPPLEVTSVVRQRAGTPLSGTSCG